jgi:hypothetical protein
MPNSPQSMVVCDSSHAMRIYICDGVFIDDPLVYYDSQVRALLVILCRLHKLMQLLRRTRGQTHEPQYCKADRFDTTTTVLMTSCRILICG